MVALVAHHFDNNEKARKKLVNTCYKKKTNKLNIYNKPVFIFNISNYWKNLKLLLNVGLHMNPV